MQCIDDGRLSGAGSMGYIYDDDDVERVNLHRDEMRMNAAGAQEDEPKQQSPSQDVLSNKVLL